MKAWIAIIFLMIYHQNSAFPSTTDDNNDIFKTDIQGFWPASEPAPSVEVFSSSPSTTPQNNVGDGGFEWNTKYTGFWTTTFSSIQPVPKTNPTTSRPFTTSQPFTTSRSFTTTRSFTTSTIETTTEGKDLSRFMNENPCVTSQKCVKWNLCRTGGTIVTDGSFLIDERSDLASKPAKLICQALQQCCRHESVVDTQLEKDEVDRNTKAECDKIEKPVTCGARNRQGLVAKVVGMQQMEQPDVNDNGQKYSQYAEFPWMMAILYQSNSVKKYRGGGSLIHPKVVITVAHILAGLDPKKTVVRGGEWEAQADNEYCMVEDRNVEKASRPDEYNSTLNDNDIMLLVLQKPFQLNAFINTICLPPKNMKFDSKKCVSAGWGSSSYGNSSIYQAYLKKVTLNVVSPDKCFKVLEAAYKRLVTSDEDQFRLHKKTICAGGEKDEDMCKGDGGSPLMCQINGTQSNYYLAGMVKGSIAGFKCGTEGLPGYYEGISEHREWIDRTLKSYKIYDPKPFTFKK